MSGTAAGAEEPSDGLSGIFLNAHHLFVDIKDRVMRKLLVAAMVWSVLAAGAVRAEDIRTDEVRPGLMVDAGTGQLNDRRRKKLSQAPDAKRKKSLLMELTRDRNYESVILDFNTYVGLALFDQPLPGDSRGELAISRDATVAGTSFNLYLKPDRRYDSEELKEAAASVTVRVRIDERPGWVGKCRAWPAEFGECRAQPSPGPGGEFHLFLEQVEFALAGDRKDFEAEFLSALRSGREMKVEADWSGGETGAVKFDLRGLNEALDLMDRRGAAIKRAYDREINRLSRQIRELD